MSARLEFSEEFVNVAGVPATAVQHMRNAVTTSHHKYGSIYDKPPSLYAKLRLAEMKAFEDDGNHEHIVNALNYDMFLYMCDSPLNTYVEDARLLAAAYDESKYKGTDSDKSVHSIKKPVTDWLRDSILGGV